MLQPAQHQRQQAHKEGALSHLLWSDVSANSKELAALRSHPTRPGKLPASLIITSDFTIIEAFRSSVRFKVPYMGWFRGKRFHPAEIVTLTSFQSIATTFKFKASEKSPSAKRQVTD
jgi:hypothetical protein